MFDPMVIAVAAVVLAAASALQSAVGFGMGLLAVPVLVWIGLGLPEAVAVLFGAALVQTGYGTWLSRRQIPWRATVGFAAVQWVCLPLGVAGMGMLAAAGPQTVKQVVGLLVAAMLLVRGLVRVEPRPRVSRGWGVLASAAAGLLAGLVGMGGPPIVLFALAHAWSKETYRGFLWATFLLVLPVAATAVAWQMGPEILRWSILGIVLTPAVWAGSKVGLRVSMRWQPPLLRRISVLLLAAIASWSIVGPFVL